MKTWQSASPSLLACQLLLCFLLPLLKPSWPPLNRWRLICYDGFRRHMWLTRASRVVRRVNEIIRLPADQDARLSPACQAPAYSSSPAKMAHVSRECYNCLPPGVHYITPLCNFLLPNNSHDVRLIITVAMQNIAYCYANEHVYFDILYNISIFISWHQNTPSCRLV